MRRRAKSGWKRASATLALLAWVSALFLCSAECLLGRCHSETSPKRAHSASHSSAAHSHEHGEHGDHHSPANAPDQNGFCCSLSMTTLAAGQDSILMPQPPMVWVLSEPALSANLSADIPESVRIRQAKRHDWVFTHEVCTAPADRSLAPPVWF